MVSWCNDNNLDLNTGKTKEMVVDFRTKNKTPIAPLTIKGQTIERVESFKFLGTTISCSLSWQDNTDIIVKKAQQRLFFLRQLKKFGLRREILKQFYRATVESVLTFSIIVWYGNLTDRQKQQLSRVVKTASKIVGDELPSLDSIYKERVKVRALKIVGDSAHPANNLFQLLPSGQRYRSFKTKNERFRKSLFPHAVTVLSKL